MTATAAPSPSAATVWLKRGLFLAVLVALAVLLKAYGGQAAGALARFAAWVESLGAWGPVVFILGYAAASVAFLPGSILTLAAGIVFGLAFGTAWAFLGATLGSCLAFLVARYLARGWVERKIEGNAKFRAIDKAVGREGWKIVALLRLSPVLPFNLLNYALGLTKVPFWQYAAASFAMLPGTLLYVYYGKAMGDLAKLAGGVQGERGAAGWALLIGGLVATLVVSIFVARKAKQAIAEEVGEEPG